MPVSTARLAARFAAAGVLGVLGLLGPAATPASAHASLVAADPADGSTVTAAPSAVTLTFDDVITRAALVVNDADGARVDSGRLRVVGTIVTKPVDLPAAGRYTIGYRVVSDDGHPVTGTLSFAFSPDGAAIAPAGAAAPSDRNSGAARTALVLGVAVLVTGLLGVALVRAQRANRRAEASSLTSPVAGETVDLRPLSVSDPVATRRRERP